MQTFLNIIDLQITYVNLTIIDYLIYLNIVLIGKTVSTKIHDNIQFTISYFLFLYHK